MTEPLECPFCKSKPAVHRHQKAPAWFKVECVSDKCSMRKVHTHACGSEAEAVRIWNDRA